MKIQGRFVKVSIISALLSPSLVFAQAEKDTQAKDQISTVQVLTPISISSFEEPKESEFTGTQSKTTLTAQEISRFRAISTGDLFKGLPGIQTGDSRNGSALDMNIRGIQGQSRVPVMIDGMPNAFEAYRGYAGTQTRSYINPDLLSSAEIIKGPSLDSKNGIGGAVQLKTIGVKDIVPEGQSFGIRATANAWNNGIRKQDSERFSTVTPRTDKKGLLDSRAKSGTLAVGYTSDMLDVVLAYARKVQGNYFSGKNGADKYSTKDIGGADKSADKRSAVNDIFPAGAEVLNSANKAETILFKTDFRPSAAQTISLNYQNNKFESSEIMGSDIYRNEDGKIQEYTDPGHVNLNMLSLGYEYDPAENDLINFKANAWTSRTSSEQINGWLTPHSQLIGDTSMQDRGWVRQHDNRWGIDLSNISKFTGLAGNFTWRNSASYQVERIKPKSSVVITRDDIYNERISADARKKQFKLASRLEYKPIDPLTLWAGISFEKYENQDHNKTLKRLRNQAYDDFINNGGTPEEAKKWGIPEYVRPTIPTTGVWGESDDFGENACSDPSKRCYVFWPKNSKTGKYEEADLNEAILFEDSNYPSDGKRVADLPKEIQDKVREIMRRNSMDPSNEAVVNLPDYALSSYNEPIRISGHAIKPAFGFSYEFLPNTLFFASYTMGIRTPSLFESAMNSSVTRLKPGAILKPEESRNIEIGASTVQDGLLETDDRLMVKGVYFDNKIKNYITRSSIIKDEQAAAFGIMQMSNADSYRVKGLELQARYDANRWYAEASFTHYIKTVTCDAKLAAIMRQDGEEAGSELKNTPDCIDGAFGGSYLASQNPPKNSVNLTIAHNFLDHDLTLGARMVYTSGPTVKMDKPWHQGFTTAQIQYKPYTVYDLFASYKVNKNIEVNAAIQNLTNRYYLDALAQSLMPAPGRTVYMGARINY